MYHIKSTLPSAKQIEIIPFGDIHLGSPNCRFAKFEKLIKYIKKTKNCYAIGMGDYLDSILPKDPRYDPSDKFKTVDDNVAKIVSTLRPIKDKIICLLTGNHEYKLNKAGYGDPTLRICRALDLKYAGYSCFIKIKCKPKTHQRNLVIFAHHGWQGGRKTGASINAVENLAQYWEADVYLVGHSHKLWSTREVRITWAGEHKVVFANTGTFLQTCTDKTTGYGEQAGYPPQKLGVIKIKYYPYAENLRTSE